MRTLSASESLFVSGGDRWGDNYGVPVESPQIPPEPGLQPVSPLMFVPGGWLVGLAQFVSEMFLRK